jgi:hypothetical protein
VRFEEEPRTELQDFKRVFDAWDAFATKCDRIVTAQLSLRETKDQFVFCGLAVISTVLQPDEHLWRCP